MSKDRVWTRAEVQLIDENEFPKNIYEIESAGQLERWFQDVLLDAYNDCVGAGVKRIVSMVERNKDESLSMSRSVNDYIMTTEGGWFSTNDIYNYLHVREYKDKKNVVTCLIRERDKGIIESNMYKSGMYRRVMADSEILNWKDAPMKPLDISWPFKIEELVDLYPSNIAVVAGNKDSGKSTLMLNIIRENMHKHKIHYFSNEMAEQELKLRLSKFDGVDINDWNFTPYLRSANYGDAVIGKEDDFIIFDWVATPDKAWRIGDVIKAIHDKLRGGFCIVVIQKESYKELGRGAGYTIDYARLYLTMQWGKMKILSGKNWHGSRNPAGLVHEFKIVNGAKIIPQGIWHEEDSDPLEKKGFGKGRY